MSAVDRVALVLARIRATTVLCCTWRHRPGESDYLEVDLSNGSLLRVYWDSQYGMRRLTVDEVYARLQADRAEVSPC